MLNRIFTAAVLCMTFAGRLAAQDVCPLPIMVEVLDTDGTLTEKNIKLLDAKLRQLVATDGIGSSTPVSHLCLTATVSETGDKQVISGNQPVVTGSYDVTLVLTNLISGENFGSESVTLHGAGKNDQAQKQAAIARLNSTDPALKQFVSQAHDKVFSYYTSHIPSIISQARAYSQRGAYDKALYILSTVPPCVDSYDDVAQAMLDTYQEYLNADCNEKLMAARAVWAVDKSDEGAAAAAAYLAAIDRRSVCYDDALALLKEISDRLDENFRRMLAQEDEARALEQEIARNDIQLEQQQAENAFKLRQQEIEAIRQIGLAYAKPMLPEQDSQNGGASQDNSVRQATSNTKGLGQRLKRALPIGSGNSGKQK